MARPRKIKTAKQFDELVDEYVAKCVADEEPITWTGLALYMGFCGRDELGNYAGYEGFSYSVKRARAIVENSYEKRLHGNSPTGAIFALKNMGWSDKQEHEHTGKEGGPIESDGTLRVEFVRPDDQAT